MQHQIGFEKGGEALGKQNDNFCLSLTREARLLRSTNNDGSSSWRSAVYCPGSWWVSDALGGGDRTLDCLVVLAGGTFCVVGQFCH